MRYSVWYTSRLADLAIISNQISKIRYHSHDVAVFIKREFENKPETDAELENKNWETN